MESKAKLFGHPLHQMLVVFPLGLLGASVVFDLLYLLGGYAGGATVAYALIAAGCVAGLLAAPWGTIDWLAIPKGTRAKAIGAMHGGGNVVVLLLFGASWWLRHEAGEPPPTAAWIASFCGTALALLDSGVSARTATGSENSEIGAGAVHGLAGWRTGGPPGCGGVTACAPGCPQFAGWAGRAAHRGRGGAAGPLSHDGLFPARERASGPSRPLNARRTSRPPAMTAAARSQGEAARPAQRSKPAPAPRVIQCSPGTPARLRSAWRSERSGAFTTGLPRPCPMPSRPLPDRWRTCSPTGQAGPDRRCPPGLRRPAGCRPWRPGHPATACPPACPRC